MQLIKSIQLLMKYQGDLDRAFDELKNTHQDRITKLEDNVDEIIENVLDRLTEDFDKPKEECLRAIHTLGSSGNFKTLKEHVVKHHILRIKDYGTTPEEMQQSYKDASFKKGLLFIFEYVDLIVQQEELKKNELKQKHK